MGYQIIRQPGGKLAVYSSFTDTWAVVDAEAAEIADWFAELAATSAREEAGRLAALVERGEERRAYHQFARPFGDANRMSREHDGAWWDGAQWIGLDDWDGPA